MEDVFWLVVFLIVVIIVVCVALAALFFYMVTNIDRSDNSRTFVYFGLPSKEPQNRSGTLVWDETFNVTKVTPSDSVLPWTLLRAAVKGPSGTVLVHRGPMAPDAGNYSTSVPISVQVWYEELAGGAGELNPGDAIKVTGLGMADGSAVLELYNGTTLLGHAPMGPVAPG